MNALAELQRGLLEFVLRGSNELPHGIRDHGISPAQRLSIYRNNAVLGLTEALRDVYPVINRLVGDGFFRYLARGYIARHPPVSGCLLDYGERMAEFLAGFDAASGLPYLPDTARLEWCWHASYHAADAPGLAVSLLTATPAERFGEIRLRLQPSARLLASAFPVWRIWQANQADSAEPEPVDLGEGGCHLLLFRPRRDPSAVPSDGLAVEVHALDCGNHRFLTALGHGSTLAQAAASACGVATDFDLSASLRHWLGLSLFSDVSLIQRDNS
jgi:hypothetical protein